MTGTLASALSLDACRDEEPLEPPPLRPELNISDRDALPWIHRSWQDAIDKHDRLLVEVPRVHGCTTQLFARFLQEGPNRCALVRGGLWRRVQRHAHVLLGSKPFGVYALEGEPPMGARYELILVDNALHRGVQDWMLEPWIEALKPGGKIAVFYHDHGIPAGRDVSWLTDLGKRDDWTWLQYGYYFDGERLHGYCDHMPGGKSYDCPDHVHWPERWHREALDKQLRAMGSDRFDRAFLVRP